MSDDWIFYPCQMGNHRAYVFFYRGIRDTIDDIAPPNLLKVRLAFRAPRDDGLSSSQEFDRLGRIEDDLQRLADDRASIYVGRVTVDRHRHFYIFTAGSEVEWEEPLAELGTRHGYELSFFVDADLERDGYWKDLYPTDDDWRVIKDLGVLDALKGHGDDGTASRRVDHWAYFPTRSGADAFATWLDDRGYVVLRLDPADDGVVSVRFHHESTLRLDVITSHTIALDRKARELGGDYDGWETQVTEPHA